jgi:quercetin dioxygenase-like cupin family protein
MRYNPAMKFAAIILFAIASLAQTGEVEITGEPLHHLTLNNDFVRVFKVEIPAHGSTILHRHRHDYVVIALTQSNMISDVQGKGPKNISMKAGEVRFATGGFAHVARNMADTSFPHVDVELLKTAEYQWDEERGVTVLEGGTHDILFVKDGVRVSEIELQPHAMIPKHTHKTPHVVVAVTGVDLESRIEGKPPKHAKLQPGEAAWVESGITHTVMNAGAKNAKFVTIEFPPNAK